MNELTAEERAYRRGAYQALSWLIQAVGIDKVHEFRSAILQARGSKDPKYLGHFLDRCAEDVKEIGK